MVDAPRGKAASTWFLPLSHLSVCSVRVHAFPFMHSLTSHEDGKQAILKQVGNRCSQIHSQGSHEWTLDTPDNRIHSTNCPEFCNRLPSSLLTPPYRASGVHVSNPGLCVWQITDGITSWKLSTSRSFLEPDNTTDYIILGIIVE